jgi:hypothetical protein
VVNCETCYVPHDDCGASYQFLLVQPSLVPGTQGGKDVQVLVCDQNGCQAPIDIPVTTCDTLPGYTYTGPSSASPSGYSTYVQLCVLLSTPVEIPITEHDRAGVFAGHVYAHCYYDSWTTSAQFCYGQPIV